MKTEKYRGQEDQDEKDSIFYRNIHDPAADLQRLFF